MILDLELAKYCNNLLEISRFEDYAPNGLQVGGGRDISLLLSGVTASEGLIDAAIKVNADAILVHHGYFWKGESSPIVDMKYNRLAKLIENDISLLAYHLPLDVHRKFGNNAHLADVLGLTISETVEINKVPDLLYLGSVNKAVTASSFGKLLSEKLKRDALHLSGGKHKIKTVAWCTGAAQDFIEQAKQHKVDAYISGEVSERTYYQAKELGIHYFSCGHHATERFGVQALGKHLAKRFSIKHRYIDIPNPV